ncbi:CaiB/BaiF CoA transferase family protein [Zavarzinia sp. CC-PAN008]|uniref:CaiB/BaiF CoA transferase family protein n=1 Tax=Zavarzinia sp. CC-PAN008 TaxID=3243332 RepID=UPI003F744055
MTQQAKGPMAGVRIIDLTQFIFGPYATQNLGDLGADVIKVEEPGGDRQRKGGKAPKSGDMGPVYMGYNRNKRSVALDLKSEAGKRALRRLIRSADLFIHNMRMETVEKLGFAYDDVAKVKPDIIYVACRGYGSDGPYAKRQAFDDLIQAASGAADLLPQLDGNPELRLLPSAVADKVSGLYGTIAMLAALNHKARTGEGQFVEVPMLESFTSFLMSEHLYGHTYDPPTGRIGFTQMLTPDRKPYPTRDGFLSVLPASQDQSARFLELGGVPGFYTSEAFKAAPDSKARVRLYYDAMRQAALSRTTEDWMAVCAEHGIPVMRANTLATLLDDPHLKAVDFFERRDLPGEGTWRSMRPPIKFARTPCEVRLEPPRIGEHTDQVMAELDRLDGGDAAAAE